MRLFRSLLVLGVALVIALAVHPADGGEQKKKKIKFVEGTVVEIQQDKESGQGHLVVKVKPKKKIAAQVQVQEERKLRLARETTFVKLQGKKAQGVTTPATLADVQKGAEVLLTLSEANAGQVERIALVAKKKKADE